MDERDVLIMEKLRRGEFHGIEDEDIVFASFAWVDEKAFSQGDKKFNETLATLPKPFQVVRAMYPIEFEINNGGYNQYYYNLGNESSTIKADEALEAIGATRIAEITRRADAVYEQIKHTLGNSMEPSTMEDFMDSYKDNPLNQFDEEFQAAYEIENLQNLWANYVKDNIDCFRE